MNKSTPRLFTVIALIGACFITVPLEAALRVPLVVRERAGVSRQQSPVTFGVPLAKSDAVMSPDALRITESDGALFIFRNGVLNCEHIINGVRQGYLREMADCASALQCGI